MIIFKSCQNLQADVYCYLLTFTLTTDPVPSSSNTSPPSVSLSGFRQISIMLKMDRFPQSLSLRALLNNFRAAVGLPVYLKAVNTKHQILYNFCNQCTYNIGIKKTSFVYMYIGFQ